jgi:hypothetical protein
MADKRLIPEGGENPYAAHPGFESQGCICQYTVTPAVYSSSSHGFGCIQSGGHCLPGDQCSDRVKRESIMRTREKNQWHGVSLLGTVGPETTLRQSMIRSGI